MVGKIKVPQCTSCGKECISGYCYECLCRCGIITRNKRQVSGEFKVVDWFSSRSSAGLIIEDSDGKQFALYMSDVFRFIKGMSFGRITLEETKKGNAYGWCVVEKEEAVVSQRQ